MTAAKIGLVALLRLAAAAAAATSLASVDLYKYDPDSSSPYYLLWFPPYAVPMN